MNETWKDITGYEGQYQVSDLGHVRSLKHGKIRILKPGRDYNGYLKVKLCQSGNERNVYLHRLVAEAFIPNPSNFPIINHKDENPANNVVTNLEWCTIKYNTNFGTGIARRSVKRSKVVLQYDKFGNFVREWPSALEVQKQTGFAHSSISECCLGKLKSAYGFIWRFK